VSTIETIAPPRSPRLLGGLRRDGRARSLAEHAGLYGALPLELRPEELLDAIGRSGLTGRGGAAFPTGTKLEAVLGRGRRPVIVANGAEGEPASGKDKSLLAYAPHLVLDGALLAARAVGANEIALAVTDVVRDPVRRALAERPRLRGVAVRVVVVPDRFVTGEETALVQFLNGGPALPTVTPPRPFERGVGGAPTAVLNVETLAHLALVARFGAGWFRSVGTREEPGSALVTISGAVRLPGVFEIELGMPLASLLSQAGADRDAQAYLVGGYFGTWVGAREAEGLELSNASLAGVGASLGARAIVVLPADACGVAETARVARYLAEQSAGQCGPCVHGLASVAENLEQLARGARETPAQAILRRRLQQVRGRGACRHPDGASALVASALRVFAGELDRHQSGRRCAATRREAVLRLP
jgi:NADH:ubiquinone oxidoreductase subunit F (NADH-binding)